MKTYIVATMHGEELFGLKVVGVLQKHENPDVKIRIGHPEAIAKRRRYIETDLNRSFAKGGDSIESGIASSIRQEISVFQPDYIIDIHTSVSKIKKVAIVASLSALVQGLSSALGMEAIVLMPKHIARGSLIGCYPEKAISLEFGKHQRSDKLAAFTAARISSLSQDLPKQTHNLPVYEVISIIPKNFKKLDKITNLEFNEDLQGYPFLAAKDTYPEMGGFLTRRIK